MPTKYPFSSNPLILNQQKTQKSTKKKERTKEKRNKEKKINFNQYLIMIKN